MYQDMWVDQQRTAAEVHVINIDQLDFMNKTNLPLVVSAQDQPGQFKCRSR